MLPSIPGTTSEHDTEVRAVIRRYRHGRPPNKIILPHNDFANQMMAMQHNTENSKPLMLRVPDVRGSYTIPYIQTSREIAFPVSFADSAHRQARAVLIAGGGDVVGICPVTPESPQARFAQLASGTYAVRVEYLDEAGGFANSATWSGISVGAILAALGDSLTEGYHGHGFWRDDLDLSADDFPAASVSRDRRNFPQFAPTAARHKPTVNCFQSWMTRLNDALSAAWRQPVFIANEGWGGYTSGQYLEMMRRNQDGWRDRMRLLRPSHWLIHLGVNDERQQVSPATFEANLRAIIGILCTDFGATPDAVHVARPSYDYAPGAEAGLGAYISRIESLAAELGLGHGPDFFTAFATDKEKWYGNDPVHPGPAGMDHMADLWREALAT
jgi:lysophospholipase L1-like esterase